MERFEPKRKKLKAVCDELFEELYAAFLAGRRRNATMRHDKTYLLGTLPRHFGRLAIDSIDEDYWESWIVKHGHKRKLFDIAKYLNKVATFAHRRGYIERKPEFINPDTHNKIGLLISEAQFSALYSLAYTQLKCKFLLGYECGLRTAECLGIKWSWLEFSSPTRAYLTLPRSFVKAGARTILLTERASKALYDLKHPGEYVFPNRDGNATSQKQLGRDIERIIAFIRETDPTFPRITFYDFRHTFLNNAIIGRGLPTRTVADYAGTSQAVLERNYLQPSAKSTEIVALTISQGGKYDSVDERKELVHSTGCM
jgi:integrase